MAQDRLSLCTDVLDHLGKVNPGSHPTMSKFMGAFAQATATLAQMEMQEGKLTRKQFLQKLKESVNMRTMAHKMIQLEDEASLVISS